MKQMLIMLVTLLLALCSTAETEVVDGIAWTYIVTDGNKVRVESGTTFTPAIPSSTTGNISIPATLGVSRRIVTSIGDYAFNGCGGLTGVTIPSGVTSIGVEAFSYCRALSGIIIPSGVKSVGSGAFSDCSGLMSATMPFGLKSISSCMFCNCSGLTSVMIPSSVTSIGSSAFSGCSSLTNVTIPSSMTSIDKRAFFDCIGLTSVTIPSSVMSIGDYAFYNCNRLTSVTISSGVESIGDYAFSDCSGLTSVTIPSTVVYTGIDTFCGCTSLDAIDFLGAPPVRVSRASIKKDAIIRYNIAYEDEWLPVIKECSFTNARPYVPGVGDMTKTDIDEWVGSTLAPKFKGAEETAADYRKRFEAKFGENCVAAFFRETGKVGKDGANLQVWHDYVAGTDPLNTNDVFTATITFDENGVPKVEFRPQFEEAEEADKREYKTLGKKSLSDEKWLEVPVGHEADYNFFKVTVEMK